jgi:hypothetical protein
MVKEKIMPSPRLCKPMSNDASWCFQYVNLEGGFSGTQIFVPEAEKHLDTTG